jgi:hypothetical protein
VFLRFYVGKGYVGTTALGCPRAEGPTLCHLRRVSSQTQSSCARRTAEGGCPHINLNLGRDQFYRIPLDCGIIPKADQPLHFRLAAEPCHLAFGVVAVGLLG